jgi:hypothetical protein
MTATVVVARDTCNGLPTVPAARSMADAGPPLRELAARRAQVGTERMGGDERQRRTTSANDEPRAARTNHERHGRNAAAEDGTRVRSGEE